MKAGFLSSLALSLLLLAAPLVAAADTLSAPTAAEAVASGDALLIDVRSPEEWAASGAPTGAKRITIHDPDGAAAFVRKVLAASAAEPDKQVVLICAGGVRSGRALAMLRSVGREDAAHVPEGVMGSASGPGWLRRGLPVVK